MSVSASSYTASILIMITSENIKNVQVFAGLYLSRFTTDSLGIRLKINYKLTEQKNLTGSPPLFPI